jgi:signal transduction histidine kinase
MSSLNAAMLVNMLGFMVGIALYGMLAAMVVRHRSRTAREPLGYLLLTTACLGLIWNASELYVVVLSDFGSSSWPLVAAAAYSALGFLPSVVVHSARNESGGTHKITFVAYGLSAAAAVLHFYDAFSGGPSPSPLALTILTYGAVMLAGGLLIFGLRETLERKSLWATALLIFAVSGLHFSGTGEGNSWVVELVAHQSSLPLALVILYQNFRFAFADLFLKRAISLLLVASMAFGLYMLIAAPFLRFHETHDRNDVLAVSLIIGLWIITALAYPWLHKLAVWLVDRVLLHRANYSDVHKQISGEIETIDSADRVLSHVTERLAEVLTADSSGWSESKGDGSGANYTTVSVERDAAVIAIATAERPSYVISVGEFHGGRRLLSDETAMLEDVSITVARRLDVLRATNERFDREMREQEIQKLAAEARLTALRAQVNPHFLFNALTTIGYLIQTNPDKAFETLLHLTRLLRSVLTATGEFSTLGDEMKLIRNYLDIERARFEERLTVRIDVAKELANIEIPALILQPLVENAIKHGIAENKNGGEVRIAAEIEPDGAYDFLVLTVSDPGSGKNEVPTRTPSGVGLENIRGRLRTHYGGSAELKISRLVTGGTTATLRMPLNQKPGRVKALGEAAISK